MSEQLIPTPSVFGETGNFLLERELGRGGMGGVYMGRDKMLDRPVAVKVMLKEYGADPEFVERFKHEAQAAARLIHPNIAQIYSYGIANGMPYIAMELVAGGSLDQLMKNAPGKTDVPRVMKIGEQVAQALRCAADQGLVHGDIKPENILLDANGNAKIVDFGLAGMQKNTDEIWGTPYYISPEKVRKEVVDYRADMYSLGATLYHALTGVAPFEGTDATAVVKKRFEGMPKKPSEVRPGLSPQIDNLVMTMLAFNKEDRYPSFEALIEAFKKVMTTGLTATQAMAAQAAGTTKTGTVARPTGKRMVINGRRTMTVRRPTAVAKPIDPEEDEDDEDEKGGSLGLKVAGVILGIIVVVGGLAGGLIWYKVHEKNAQEEAYQSTITKGCTEAREAIAGTRKAAETFATEFETFAEKATDGYGKATAQLIKLLPDYAADLKFPPTKDLMEAMAAMSSDALLSSTNAMNAAAQEVATNGAVPAEMATATTAMMGMLANAMTNLPAAMASTPAAATPAAEPEKKLPSVVKDMQVVWERTCSCQASAIRIRLAIRKVVAECDKANAITGMTKESMDVLVGLSQKVKDMYEEVRGSKDVESVRKNIAYITSRGEKAVKNTEKDLRIKHLQGIRDEAAATKAAEEAARQKRLEEERKAKIEAETQAIKDKFEAIAASGSFKLLDWPHALRQLNSLKSTFTMAESSLAADVEIRKVNAMKAVQDVLIQNMVGHKFRSGTRVLNLRGCTVKSANKDEIRLVRADGSTPMKLTWRRFYKDCSGNLNELINEFIVKGKNVSTYNKGKLALKPWSEAMFGAALTMRLICPEANGAIERSVELIKETVRQFPDSLKVAQAMFPDVPLDDVESEEE